MNITVLCGGISPERDVSLKSGELVAKALKEAGHNVILMDVYMGMELNGKNASDVFGEGGTGNDPAFSMGIGTEVPDLETIQKSRGGNDDYFGSNVIEICKASDIVFMALHGSDGENGRVQAAFDLFNIKYTGSGFFSCALAMDKHMAKKQFRIKGVPVPEGILLKSTDPIPEYRLPCVVKPLSSGSSVGVTIASTPEEYRRGLEAAFKWEDKVLIEDYICGREFSVGVMEFEALPVIEIVPKEGFYDYKNKYTAGQTLEYCPADIPADVAQKMQQYAVMACKCLGLSTYARMDFIWDTETNGLYCLEANTLPGMTPMSLVPQEAAAIGMSYIQLCEKIIEISLRKNDGKRRDPFT